MGTTYSAQRWVSPEIQNRTTSSESYAAFDSNVAIDHHFDGQLQHFPCSNGME
jgi:hypothetical protein